jgi:hypothetical protein
MFDLDNVRKKIVPVLSTGAFQKFNEGEIGLREKLLSVAHLLRKCVFTRDAQARKLFWALVNIVAKKKTTPGVVVEFLLFVLSFHGYLEYTRQHRDEILEKIAKTDKGAFVKG